MEYTVPENVATTIEGAFLNNTNLEQLNLPASFVSWGGVANNRIIELIFATTTALKAINVAEGNLVYASTNGVLVNKATTPKELIGSPVGLVEAIIDASIVTSTTTNRVFGRSPNMRKITFTEGFTAIGNNSIRMNASENITDGSQALAEVYLPSTLASIGDGAFVRRGNVSLVVCRAATPPTLGGNAFFALGDNVKDQLKIYVPATSLSLYTSPVWGVQMNSITAAKFVGFYNVTISNTDKTGSSVESTIGSDIGFATGTVTITAPTAPAGKQFDKWVASSSAGTVTLVNENLATTTFTMPAADVTLTATYVTTPTAIENTESNTTAKVYPNPATDYINVTGAEGNYTIYNIMGSIAAQGILGSTVNTIPVGELANGTYFFKAGDKVIRFIKK